MAITFVDESLYHATDALILRSPRKYYRAFMRADHWQLRSFISSPKPGIIYYPFGPDVYRLNTITREREYVATISFSPKCMVSAGGWLCCGGDGGDFSTIRFISREGQTRLATEVRAEADSRLPLDLSPLPRLEASEQVQSVAEPTSLLLHYESSTKVGEQLVNCITLWFPTSDCSDETYTKPVAVLSSNDHSVAILDLEDRVILEKLELEDCVNRATISPNGRLLIAIGDDPYMHIYARKQKGPINKGLFTPKAGREFEWVKCRQIHLKGQRSTDTDEKRGSFAMAFAPSGRYLAVGTQYGIISVFETSYLTNLDADPLMVTFTTSRPLTKSGAVRAMEFSPEPYDLLAWTEDHGRVAVADIRRCFMSRQVIIMDPREEGVERVGIIERSDDLVIDPRLRQFRIDPDGNPSDSIGAEMERQQLRHLAREGSDRVHSPLTPDETEVLEALQVSRRQREREASRQNSTSVSTHSPPVWPDLVDDIRSSWRDRNGIPSTSSSTLGDEIRSNWRDHALGRGGAPNALPASLREFISGGRSSDSLRTETLRAFINERNQERERRSQQPRHRGSLILAAAGTALNRDSQETSNGQRSTAGDLAAIRDRITPIPPRLPAIPTDSPTNPWAEIEALYNLAVDPPVDSTTRMRIELAAENRRQFTRRLEQRSRGYFQRDEQSSRLDHREFSRGSGIPLEPAETTGCCWSQDGKILYVGAEHGIYEYHVNIVGRKSFPSITFL